jgi:hypothetical protein
MKEFFARLNPTERRFVVGVVVVFFIVINLVWVWPHFADWSATRTKMDTASANLAKFAGGTNLIPGLRMEIEKYQKQGEVVPQADQAVRFVRLIQNEESKVAINHISMNPGRQASGGTSNAYFMEQSENLVLECSEKQLVDFLYNLGNGPSLIRVRALSVQPDPSHQRLSTRVTLVASYQKKAVGPATPAATPAAASKPPVSKPPASNQKPAGTSMPKVTPMTPKVPNGPGSPPANALRPFGGTNRPAPGAPGAIRNLTPTNK